METSTICELVLLGAIALAVFVTVIVIGSFLFRQRESITPESFRREESMPPKSETIRHTFEQKKAFRAWLEAEDELLVLLKNYQMRVHPYGPDALRVNLAVLDYLSFSMSPAIRNFEDLPKVVFAGSYPSIDALEASLEVARETYSEIEDLLMMWRSDHVLNISEGEVVLEIKWNANERIVSNADAKAKAEERGLVDMLRCYYEDGLPAADLAA